MRIAQLISRKNSNPHKYRPVTLAFLGDSVTQGCFELRVTGAQSIYSPCRPERAYHALLRQMLEALFPDCPLNIINAGVGGDSAPGGLIRLKRDVLSFHPDLCVVCYGLNDVCQGLTGLDAYKAALEGIFSALSDEGIEAVCLLPNMLATYVPEEVRHPFVRELSAQLVARQINGDMDAYMEAARAVARARGVPLCDCYADWKRLNQLGADTTHLLANRINHPTEQMHYLFAQALLRLLLGLQPLSCSSGAQAL